jgi:CheY-like chemotaxis protein
MTNDDSEQEPSTVPGEQEPRTARALILIAESDPQRRTLYTDILREAGYEVVNVRNAAMALTEAAQLAPDLIIAQLSEPTTDGFELCRKLRLDADTRHTPLLVLTRFDDPYTREQIVRAGATAILIEPMRRALLLRQVHRLLARARAHGPVGVSARRAAEIRG